MIDRATRSALVFAASAVFTWGAHCHAQWATDPQSTLAVAAASSEQVQAKVVPTQDGGSYISWFDNSAGGYDVRLQRLDAAGNKQWGADGLLIADRAFSSTQDYALEVDATGNAVLAYRDDGGVSGATAQVSVQKVSPAGTKLWGPTGVLVTSDSVGKNQPRLAIATDGSVYVGWSFQPSGSASQFALQRLGAGGTVDWLLPVVVAEASRALTLSDLKPGDGGSVIALWVRATGANPITSAKHLYTQKFSIAGDTQWNSGSPVIVFESTSIQNGYFPTMLADGLGGAVYGWYETGGSRNAYIQHVLSTGALKFASPVANTDATPGRIRVGAALAYDGSSGTYLLASPETDSSSQSVNSVIAQQFDSSGARLWGDAGATLVGPTASMQPSFVTCRVAGDGCIAAWIETASFQNAKVVAARVDVQGDVEWSVDVSTISGGKSRLASTTVANGDVVFAFQNGDFGNFDVYAQNLRADGTLGPGGGCTSPCLSDIDCSGAVDLADLLLFLTDWLPELGMTGPNLAGDRNNDGVVDLADLLDFLSAWQVELGSCGL
ncbi:MAG: hypothetical protein KF768_07230 [Phycisphaeraceae bacterium]|nr:hypothetical protein [Phycisphaeraceae bacterium]